MQIVDKCNCDNGPDFASHFAENGRERMRWARTVSMVEAHAEGEVGRIVTGGVIDVPGATMSEKLRYLNEVDDSLRRFLVF
ncbi:MAG: proline racemase family protein, partial [Cucumibacter sp.]